MCGLMEQYKACEKYKELGIHIRPDEKNLYRCYYAFDGITGSIFDGGQYFGILDLPKDFPRLAPKVQMTTPNGRFRTGTSLCINWSYYSFCLTKYGEPCALAEYVRALRGFMLVNEGGTGSMSSTDDMIKQYARSSRTNNSCDTVFQDIFYDLVIGYEKVSQSKASPETVKTVAKNPTASKKQQTVKPAKKSKKSYKFARFVEYIKGKRASKT